MIGAEAMDSSTQCKWGYDSNLDGPISIMVGQIGLGDTDQEIAVDIIHQACINK